MRDTRARRRWPNEGGRELRRSYASKAFALGESLLMIGGPLSHMQVETIARHGNLAEDSVRPLPERVSARSTCRALPKARNRVKEQFYVPSIDTNGT